MTIDIEPEKLWDLLLKAEILECESSAELRYVQHLYPTSLYEIDPECTYITISYPDTLDDSWELSKEEVLGCTAVWDTETEEITITEFDGAECYLPPFRVYRSIKPDL